MRACLFVELNHYTVRVHALDSTIVYTVRVATNMPNAFMQRVLYLPRRGMFERHRALYVLSTIDFQILSSYHFFHVFFCIGNFSSVNRVCTSYYR